MDKNLYIVFAGVNDAGKSTLYSRERGGIQLLPYINPDAIAVQMGLDWRIEKDGAIAAHEAVRQIRAHLSRRESFVQETTLAGASSLSTIRKAKELGYTVLIRYVGVADVSVAQSRIAHRLSVGGRGIPEDVVKRRYTVSLANLKTAIQLSDRVDVYDNTYGIALIAAYERYRHSARCDVRLGLRWLKSVV